MDGKFLRKPELKELTLREKIGQTACPHITIVLYAQNIPEYMKKNPYGSIWVSGNTKPDFVNLAYEVDEDNVDTEYSNAFRKFIKEVNSGLRIPIMPGMDAELGAKRVICTLTELSTQTGLAATGDPNIVYQTGACVGKEVKSCGVRWVWGPVADNAPPNVPVELGRTFSCDPDKIIEYTNAYSRGLQSEGVGATLKHFPGYDSFDYRDSHITPTSIRDSYQVWYERQGRVFEDCSKSGVYSIMAGHASFPAVDSSMRNGLYVPAPASSKIINGLLRQKFGYSGVVVSDAVGMGAICDYFDNNLDMYVAMYNAGVDIILGPNDFNFIDMIEEAVLSGKLSEKVIDTACQRVLDMKEKLGLFSPTDTLPSERQAVAETKAFSQKIANKIISWVQNRGDLIPLKKDAVKKVALVYIGYSKTAESFFDCIKDEFNLHGAKATIFSDVLTKNEILAIKEEYDLTIYFIHLAPHSPYGSGGFNEEKAQMFNYITKVDREQSIAVSTVSPWVWFDWLPGADRFVNLYGLDEEVLRAFVKGIYGECEFEGKCPMPLEPFRR